MYLRCDECRTRLKDDGLIQPRGVGGGLLNRGPGCLGGWSSSFLVMGRSFGSSHTTGRPKAELRQATIDAKS